MLIEPLELLTVRLPEGERQLEPGTSYSFPELYAQKLLAKAPGRVRLVKSSQSEDPPMEQVAFDMNANVRPEPAGDSPTKKNVYPAGSLVHFHSPLFGELQAQVLDDNGACVWIWHPLRECEANIPRNWIMGDKVTGP